MLHQQRPDLLLEETGIFDGVTLRWSREKQSQTDGTDKIHWSAIRQSMRQKASRPPPQSPPVAADVRRLISIYLVRALSRRLLRVWYYDL